MLVGCDCGEMYCMQGCLKEGAGGLLFVVLPALVATPLIIIFECAVSCMHMQK